MSRRRRRRRPCRSSCCSKHSSSPFHCRRSSRSPGSSTLCENRPAEGGETHPPLGESDEGEDSEPEVPSKEKRLRRDGPGGRGAKAGVRIVTSVTVDENDVSSLQVVFQLSTATVTTTEIRHVSSGAKLEITEVLRRGPSHIETTFVVHDRREKSNKTSFKNQRDTVFSPNHETFGQTCSSGQIPSTSWEGRGCENYKVSIAKVDSSTKEVRKETVSGKSCCEGMFLPCRLHRPRAGDGHSCLQPSQPGSRGTDILSRNTISSEVLPDIPPPRQFADRICRSLEDLVRDIASCHIGSTNTCDGQSGAPSSPAESDGTRYGISSSHRYSGDGENQSEGVLSQQQSESDTYDPFFTDPKMIKSRSSFTKDFIHSHEGKTWLRNNSIGIIETKPRASDFLGKRLRRRKTFPSVEDCSAKIQESLVLHRESISSGTISPFFSQSLSLQAAKSGHVYKEDERTCGFYPSEGCSSYKQSCGHFSDRTGFLLSLPSYDSIKNSQPNSEERLSDFGQFVQEGQKLHASMETPDVKYGSHTHEDAADQDGFGAGPTDQSEVAESGFDEEMADPEDHAEGFSEERAQKNLLIQVIPPSRSTSQDSAVLSKLPQQEATGSNGAPRRRGASVVTVITGSCEQRCFQKDPETPQENVYCTVYEGPYVSPTLDMDDMETAKNSDVPGEAKASPPKAASTSLSKPRIKISGVQRSSEEQTDTLAAAEPTGRRSIRREDEEMMVPTERPCSPGLNKDTTRLHKTGSAEKINVPIVPVDVKAEVKEHLKPPDPGLKEQEDAPDRWAKRRKLFKESRQWSSAGGSSITSNITEESMNSEDGPSAELSARDIEDRGFYTETFHSASWIFRGDEVHPKTSPGCLSSRPRPVTTDISVFGAGNAAVLSSFRERTVRISKGAGDYPWGFRIQFSKPIVVTEVDTNGAAEEAGLQVGDYVLSVNGTDVTSVPHSEAADLARQGPDLLTLTIGSDISRLPNTPRPACRGYLHKRTQSGFLRGWRKRWFVLKHDRCLYYYRHKKDEGRSAALSVVPLEGAEVGPEPSLGKPFVFKCSPLAASRVFYFCTTSNQEMKRWLEAMERAVHPVSQNHVWIDVTRHNANLPPLAIKNPECLGLLHQMDRMNDTWLQHYCILKDGCLYFYPSIRSTRALGGIFLHGYTVKEQPVGSKRSAIELKPPSEEFKTFHVCAENPTENKRWIAALRASISKWLPLHQAIQDLANRPPEETRM